MRVLHFLQRILHVMHSILRRLDLNLLLVFDALYRLRTVARAAEDLSIGSSAFSHALSRLRSAFNDELFLRAGGVMSPTPRADELSGSIAEALQLLSKGIGDASTFDPSTSEQTFIFSATDFTSFALLPTLIAHIEQVAPRVQFRVVASQSRNAISDLTAGAHRSCAGRLRRGGEAWPSTHRQVVDHDPLHGGAARGGQALAAGTRRH